MLNIRIPAALLSLAALLGACSQTAPQPPQAVKLTADYQLTFNDALVGRVMFDLDIAADGHYQIEAFTTPAGTMGTADDLEVLEISRGTLDSEQVRPVRFEHSVMQSERLEVVSLSFDWEGRQLAVLNGEASQQLGLLPDTHDRLSYLLIAGRLSRETSGELQHIQVASVEATEETVLQSIGQADVEVPLGHFAATGIRRLTPDETEERELWYDQALSPLPLRVVRRWDGNVVEMQIESIQREEVQPPAEPPAE